MFKSPIFWVIVIAILAIVAYAVKQGLALYNYCWAIAAEKTKIISASINKVNIEMFIRFGNRSNTDVNIRSYDLTVYMNGIEISKIFSKQKQLLKSDDVSDVQLTIQANPSDIFKSNKSKLLELGQYFISDKSKIVFKIVGSASVGAFGISASNIPIDISMSLKEMMAPSTEPTVPCKKK